MPRGGSAQDQFSGGGAGSVSGVSGMGGEGSGGPPSLSINNPAPMGTETGFDIVRALQGMLVGGPAIGIGSGFFGGSQFGPATPEEIAAMSPADQAAYAAAVAASQEGGASPFGGAQGGDGLISSLNSALTGGGGDKFTQAGAIQALAQLQGAGVESAAIQQAIDQIQSFGGFDPFASAGGQAFQDFQSGSTIGGFGRNLDEIMQGDTFRGLVDERTRALENQLSASGLTRSGLVSEFGNIPQNAALDIESLLSGRQQSAAGIGLQATGQQADLQTIISQLLSNQGNVRAGGITGAAEATAGGILGQEGFNLTQQQAAADTRNQQIGLGLQLLELFNA